MGKIQKQRKEDNQIDSFNIFLDHYQNIWPDIWLFGLRRRNEKHYMESYANNFNNSVAYCRFDPFLSNARTDINNGQ